MRLTCAQDYDFSALTAEMVGLGYQRVELVVDRGELAVRGGILDIFPQGYATPVRLEFLDKTLDSIRSFNILDQRSLTKLEFVDIKPYQPLPKALIRATDFSEAEDYLLPDFQPGDYVVHENYGIAIFRGLTYLQEESVAGEYYELQFAGSERVYVPLNQSRWLHRYSAGAACPELTRLSAKNNSWEKTKQKARTAAKNIALELFNLYRLRKLTTGWPCPEDTEQQLAVEEDFPYEETPDQLEAIAAVKRDMEAPCPMDRLICGDVGFGKTEIALRAACKMALSGKQVAMLAPTTILVSQHYRNFLARLQGCGLQIQMLSRFHTAAENLRIVRELKAGRVDIVIGTHRLLQKDIGFRDLGLLIVDEEQRFGVEHKEFIKRLTVNVDILTLSATPIPRTMYLSLSGMRDISILRTPPKARRAIKTVLSGYSDAALRRALTSELARGGQVFVLNDDIKTLGYWQRKIKELTPAARAAVTHGRMPKADLEKAVLDFVERRTDVLLCTTIIENGIDIPGANTIVVLQADHFGLAQLHQIRGRVGRSAQQAYAYLFYNPAKVLRAEAESRLHALKEFTMLGAGYRLAMRDLEIRGSGNILGAQQSGFVQNVGFTLYSKMLEESVREVRGETVEPEKIFKLPAAQENYLPEDYLAEEVLRIAFYRRIMDAKSLAEVENIEQDLRDRFGELPRPTQNLLQNIRAQLTPRQSLPRRPKTFYVQKKRQKH
ncbi:transcription-repair coupling factor [Candidatus Termititenax persephonae]|uniref:Transcription-repair-coupling factor n=1 Tax=Candidatus Termititenax persephonae TaxID=2218525 RepID=A0A388TEL8_9BACT|nr:transcription-repair coupling factor [Candidatus Termititenax persephonae]